MSTNESTEFKMSLDERGNDSGLPNDMEDSRIKKLNHKITLIAILIPCIITAILLIAYLDITKRVIKSHDTETVQVENLSQDLESRLTALSNENHTLKESTEKRLQALDQIASDFTLSKKKAKKQIQSLKTENKELSHTVTDTKKAVTALKTEMENVLLEVGNFAGLSKAIEESSILLGELQKSINGLSSLTIKNETRIVALENRYKDTFEKTDVSVKDLEHKIISLHRKVIILEKISKKPKSAKPDSTKIDHRRPKTPQPLLKNNDNSTPPPHSNDIIEQDISE